MKIIFIAGYPRSGSTILDVLIRKSGNSDFISIGEFFYIFEKGYKNNELCADNVRFLEHPLWTKALQNLNIKKAHKDLKIFKNPFLFPFFFIIGIVNRNFLNFLFPNLYEFTKKVFSRINDISNNRILIDASKDPRQLFLLSMYDFLDINVIHIIRDSRATSFSWKKKKVYKNGIFFKKKNVLQSSLRWLNDHIWILLISNIFYPKKYQRVIYEKLYLKKHFNFFNNQYLINYKKTSTKFNIEIGGNSNKFHNFKSLAIDREWVRNIKNFDFFITTCLTLPLLIYFRYRVKK